MPFHVALAKFDRLLPTQQKGVRIRLALSPLTGEAAFAKAVADELGRKPLPPL